jgi:hypothetical protein
MRRRRHHIPLAARLAAVALMLMAPAADAYVPDGGQILDAMAEAIGPWQRVEVVQRLRLLAEHGSEKPVEFTETLRYVFPDTRRSDIHTPDLHRVNLVSGVDEWTVVDRRLSAPSGSAFTRYAAVLLCRSRPLLEQRLTQMGVDVAVSSLGRLEGRVDFVVGARYPDPSASQLWVDRETFLPTRWRTAAGGGQPAAEPLDIRYLQWSPTAGLWYPARMVFFRGQRLVREILVENIRVNPDFDADLFDPGRLTAARTLPSASPPPRGGGSGAFEDMTDIREAIEAFRKTYTDRPD